MRRTASSPDVAAPRQWAVPQRGYVVSTASERFGTPLRQAVAAIARQLGGLNGTPAPEETAAILRRSEAEMAAWHICARWVIAVASQQLPLSSTLVDATEWFEEGTPENLRQLAQEASKGPALEKLAHIRESWDREAVAGLLPYIFDPHGPGSRLSVRRDPATRHARARKRRDGVFYTPADVADHMVGGAFEALSPSHPKTVLDPACGTGVFLRSALSFLSRLHTRADPFILAEQSLFGIDIDPWAVDAAAYVILHDVMNVSPLAKAQPVVAWALLRLNFAVGDALLLDPPVDGISSRGFANDRAEQRRRIRAGQVFRSAAPQLNRRTPIDSIFPEIGLGARLIVGNPPYAAIGDRQDTNVLFPIFTTLRGNGADIHPLFVEQMVRLAAADASCSMVVPLAVAFNSRPQFEALRELASRTAGTWRFSFFDREPHALFGEDAKTRNSIISWSRRSGDTTSLLLTGPLQKWRGDGRAAMFASIRHTEYHGSVRAGIPKLQDEKHSRSLKALESCPARLGDLVANSEGAQLASALQANDKTVFVASTAYNFINVFRCIPSHLGRGIRLSENAVHALTCPSAATAAAVYALLSSKTAYWLWHIHGDGFHVGRGFLLALTLGPVLASSEGLCRLGEIGDELWSRRKWTPVVSNNAGMTSLAFPASSEPASQAAIDRIILEAAGLRGAFEIELRDFVKSVVQATSLRPSKN